VALCTVGGAMTVVVFSAQAHEPEVPPWSDCLSERQSNQIIDEYSKLLSPLDGATVVAATPVTFLGRGGDGASPITFMVATSPALLSSPDIDSGTGSLVSPEHLSEFTFTSSKAAATPRTIYWTASFTHVLNGCKEPPVTFTLPPRTLTVIPSPAEEAAATKKEEEEAAAAGYVSLDGAIMNVRNTHQGVVKLTCADTAACSGKLTLTAKSATGKGKKKHTKTEIIGTASFSIAANTTARINLTLSKSWRALLAGAHGHLNATLTILKTSPAPIKTQTQSVRLEQQKLANAKESSARISNVRLRLGSLRDVSTGAAHLPT
jgi:hypothetical protein